MGQRHGTQRLVRATQSAGYVGAKVCGYRQRGERGWVQRRQAQTAAGLAVLRARLAGSIDVMRGAKAAVAWGGAQQPGRQLRAAVGLNENRSAPVKHC